jgi:cytoskeletal protein CcmA (bactofilin family)
MPADQQSRSDNSPGTSTIGEGLVIDGNVTSNSPLHIDGRVHGDVQCASLVLGENSEIEGNVVAEDVVICGRLIGSVRGVRVILQSSCHVEGDLLHASLAMERGAYFEESRGALGSFGCRPPAEAAADERGPPWRQRKPLKLHRSLNGSNNADDHRLTSFSVGGSCLDQRTKELLSPKG